MSSSCPPTRLERRMGDAQNLPFPVTEQGSDNGIWGDVRKKMVDDCFRIGFWNCGGFPQQRNDGKNIFIRQTLQQYNFDVFGFSECNVYWPALSVRDRLPERTLGWFESLHIKSSFLDPWNVGTAFQVGGVSLWSINKGTHRVMSSEGDSGNLGRWSWTKYRGRNGLVLRIVVAYRCVLNKDGVLSAWNQQKTVLNGLGDDDDPRDKFVSDLLMLVDEWLDLGEQIVIGLDLNEDVTSAVFSQQLRRRGIVECITSRHGRNAPATYHRGSHPIDGIYVSPSLKDVPCGYLPFCGDHRILWVDLPYAVAFGSHLPALVPRARRLKLQDPRVVHRYQELLHEFYINHQVYDLMDSLDSSIIDSLSPGQSSVYERLDELRVQGMRYAERHCRKLRMGSVDFTPQYSLLSKKVSAWNAIVRFKSGKRVDSRFLSRSIRSIQVTRDYIHSLTYDQALSLRNSAYSSLRAYSKGSTSSRESWLHELSQARAEAGDLTAEQEYLMLITRERQRRNARIIKSVFQSGSNFGLSQLHRHAPDGSLLTIDDKDTMEEMLIDELQVRFNQASSTPFLTPPLLQMVGPLGTSPIASTILQGSFSAPDGLDYWTAKLIPHLQYTSQALEVLHSFPTTFSTQAYCEGWKKMRERTSPGFSQLSFAQFKASALHPSLAEVDCFMSEIPYRTGYSPLRWQKGIDVMLQKQPGNFLPSKLRAILLYESDFNQNNKLLGRELMYWAEKTHSVAMEQFGSRKFRSAIDQSLNKVLTFDLWRQLKCTGALCSNDAKSCYDRIVHSVASLCMQRIGVPIQPIVSMFSTIQSLSHYIRTLHGVSTTSFSGASWDPPIQGVGQGNGAGPQIWAAVSTPVLNMLRSERLGSMFKSAISHDQLFFVGYAFVDDTDLVVSNQASSDRQSIVTSMQSSVSAWEGGIRATGGAIVPEKSHWYLIDFKWHNGIASYCTIEDSPATLRVRDSSGQLRLLRRLEPWEADRTLGVRLAPDGNMQVQFRHMLEQSTLWADKLRSGHLPRSLVHHAFCTTITRSLQYPLPATTLSWSQCKAIMSPLLKQVLPQMGCIRNFPNALRFAPKQFLGLNLPNLYWIQGVEHLDRLVRYGCSMHITGRLLRHSLEALQLEIGVPDSVFTLPFSEYGHLATTTWLTSTWQFASSHSILVDSGDTGLILQRQEDRFLIPLFYSKGFKGKQLQQLNICRLFLQVVTVSDITTGCGRFITLAAWQGLRDSSRVSIYNWPTQQDVPKEYWDLWRTALSTLTITGYQLQVPLGPWINVSGVRFWFSPYDERIYEKEHLDWYFWARIPGRASRSATALFGNRSQCTERPNILLPATVMIQGTRLRVTGYTPYVPSPVPVISSLHDYIQVKIPLSAHWAIASFQFTGNDSPLRTVENCQVSFRAVSDGSFKDAHGTASWIIQCVTFPECQWRGSIITPGSSDIQSAYRSELSGLDAIVSMLYVVQTYYTLPNIHINIGCDGLSALNKVQSEDDFINPNLDHFDIIYAIRQISMKIKGTVLWRHIKGHQDDVEDSILDDWALLNIAMDNEAKKYWTETFGMNEEQRVHRIWCEPWSVSLPSGKISSDFRNSLLHWLGRQEALAHWSKRYDFPDPSPVRNWSVYSSALKTFPFSRQVWVSKWLAGFLPTAQNMFRWNFRSDDRCSRCDASSETSLHLIKCNSPAASALWNEQISKLQMWLMSNDTYSDMALAICDRLRSWQMDQPPTLRPVNRFNLSAALNAQDQFGWDKFFLGFLCYEWEMVISSYFKATNCRRSVKRWIVALLQKLWNIAWDMWEQRNGFLHDKETGLLCEQLNSQIQQQFALGSASLTVSARRLLRGGIDNVLALSLNEKMAWVRRIEAARESFRQSQRSNENDFQRERQTMFRWLFPS